MLLHRCQHSQITLYAAVVVVSNVVLNHGNKFLTAREPSAVVPFSFENERYPNFGWWGCRSFSVLNLSAGNTEGQGLQVCPHGHSDYRRTTYLHRILLCRSRRSQHTVSPSVWQGTLPFPVPLIDGHHVPGQVAQEPDTGGIPVHDTVVLWIHAVLPEDLFFVFPECSNTRH